MGASCPPHYVDTLAPYFNSSVVIPKEKTMRVIEELEALERKAILISKIPDRKLRHKGGLMLENNCRRLDEQYRVIGGLNPQAEVSLRAVIQIIFDYILYDMLEDEDWQTVMPESYEGDIEQALKEMKNSAS